MPDTDENTVETIIENNPAAAPLVAVPAKEEPAPTSRTDKALIIVGNHKFPKDGKQLVIVAEERTPNSDGVPQHKISGYPAGADIYYATDVATQFPEGSKEVLILGVNVQQENFWGFRSEVGHVCVGPAHPAYAAANIAWQRGCAEITIVGLSQSEKDHLQIFFDKLSTDPIAPAQVQVSLA